MENADLLVKAEAQLKALQDAKKDDDKKDNNKGDNSNNNNSNNTNNGINGNQNPGTQTNCQTGKSNKTDRIFQKEKKHS